MLITLTTDFGTSDYFVGAMKGVILGIAPRAGIVDITHEITPFEVNEAAFTISEAARWFPRGTIHVVVVDPGVGTARRPILVEAAGQRFIGPDNGVFTMVYDSASHKVREITNTKMMLKTVSRTFHGRDVFAPAAAHLANGVAAGRFGKRVNDFVRSETVKPARVTKGRWSGRVLKVDHFGNLITNFHMREFGELRTRAFEVLAGSQVIRRLALTYAESGIGELVAIEGSSGFLELSANQASAAEKLGCGVGAAIELEIF
jgi:S-adenosylmethionine hydrolase